MNQAPIIVRRKGRKKREQSHGAWKVAFADLMVVLMSFFLILWVLQIIDTEDREKLINFFKDGNVEMVSHGHGLGNSIDPILLPNVATTRVERELEYVTEESSLIQGEFNTQAELELLATRIKRELLEIDPDHSVGVEVTPQGIKLTIADSQEGSMFTRGGAIITPYYEDLLVNLAPLIKSIENSMVITGHTDAVKFVGRRDSNWTLSSERANVARNTLVAGGLEQSHVFQVSGMADTALLNKADPSSSINRRVELFILTRSAKEMMETVYKPSDRDYDDNLYLNDYLRQHEIADDRAKANQIRDSFDVSLENNHKTL